MDKNNDGNSEYNTKYANASIDNENASNSDKITIHVDKNDEQIYRRDSDINNKITTSTSDAALNPFIAAMYMWQNYAKAWTDTYKQLFFKNPSIPNGEFWFMYCRFDSKSKKMDEK
ncbi:MAG: hypothetical protein H0U27_13750 [Nitrosopumilus sp.]|nr:hypothetical protein [Nitrosopumilus sp.]